MNDSSPELQLVKGTQIAPAEVVWLWVGYIPKAKLTLLQGDPGTGKSTFLMNIAALLTKGEKLPFAEEALPPMNVIYQTTEDDYDDTVIPRFIKAGGDLERFFHIEESENPLSFSDPRIEQAIREVNAGLLILDPVSSYISSKASMNNANEVRAQMNPLIKVARSTGCAILLVAHMNKKKDMSALMRVTGSIDFVGAVRSALLIAAMEDETSSKRVLAVTKSNLAEKGASIYFMLGDKIEWLEMSEITADEALSMIPSEGKRRGSKMQIAMDVLTECLSDGQKPGKDLTDKLEKMGISKKTVDTAKKQLRIESIRSGRDSVWMWRLPP